MKKSMTFIIAFALVFALAITACGGKKNTENSASSEVNTTESDKESAKPEQKKNTASDDEVEKYAKDIGASAYYRGSFVPDQVLFFTESSLVQTMFAGGNAITSTEIPYDSISNVENNNVGGFVSFTVTDVSGKMINMMFNTETGKEVQKKIREIGR